MAGRFLLPKTMLWLSALTLATLAGGALAQTLSAPELPGWMAGCWVQEQDEQWTEECWTAPRAGIMLGSGRNGNGDRLGSWEVMQIVMDAHDDEGAANRMSFYGAPGGTGRTQFTWQPGGKGVTFVNASHDYPQQIHYWRDGERLVAEVSLLDGSRANRWTYRRSNSPGNAGPK